MRWLRCRRCRRLVQLYVLLLILNARDSARRETINREFFTFFYNSTILQSSP